MSRRTRFSSNTSPSIVAELGWEGKFLFEESGTVQGWNLNMEVADESDASLVAVASWMCGWEMAAYFAGKHRPNFFAQVPGPGTPA